MQPRAKDRSTGVTLRRWFALALCVAAAACSSVRLGYNNADTLLLYTLDTYLDLNEQQEELVRERMRVLLAWHRATQVRGYAEFLEAAGKRLDNRVSSDEIFAFNVEMNRRLVMLGDRAAPDLAALALTLQPAQLERFARKLADDDSKNRREAGATGAKRSLERRAKRNTERAEEWFGSVTPQQHELIRAALATRPDGEDFWVREREQRRQDLLRVLQRIQSERPATDEAARWLRDYFARLAEPTDGERRARMDEYRHANAELIASLVNAATPEQKAVLHKKLHGYAEDFASLAAPARS